MFRLAIDARTDVIGQPILLGGVAHAIVGVMPAGFRTVPAADLWTPLRLAPTDTSWNYTSNCVGPSNVPRALTASSQYSRRA